MFRYLTPSLLITASVFAFACEEEKKDEPATATEAVAAEKPADQPAKAEADPEKAAAEKAAEEAEEEKKKAQAEVDANPLTECCRALGKKGFVERSPEYVAASKVCGEAMTNKEDVDKALPNIKKELKGKALPDECSK